MVKCFRLSVIYAEYHIFIGLLSVVMLNVVILSFVLSIMFWVENFAVMLSVTSHFHCYAKCHYAECRLALASRHQMKA
jgi:hypothetical protein